MSGPQQWMIIWNYGYGDMADVIEAETHEEATDAAYQQWKEDAENNATYRAETLTADHELRAYRMGERRAAA